MNPRNTVSIQVWCPDIVELSFEESVTAKPDLSVFRLSDGTVSQNLRKTFKRLMFDTGLFICPPFIQEVNNEYMMHIKS